MPRGTNDAVDCGGWLARIYVIPTFPLANTANYSHTHKLATSYHWPCAVARRRVGTQPAGGDALPCERHSVFRPGRAWSTPIEASAWLQWIQLRELLDQFAAAIILGGSNGNLD